MRQVDLLPYWLTAVALAVVTGGEWFLIWGYWSGDHSQWRTIGSLIWPIFGLLGMTHTFYWLAPRPAKAKVVKPDQPVTSKQSKTAANDGTIKLIETVANGDSRMRKMQQEAANGNGQKKKAA